MGEAVIYVRVSTTEQVENYSLENQTRSCVDYCARNGLAVRRIYTEEGESAKTADRPQLQALLADCVTDRRRVVTHLIVDRVDRLSRVAGDYQQIRNLLERVGVRVHAVQEQFDDSPSGRLIENLMASLAQFDNDTRAQRTRDGMRAAATEGRWVWRPPIGYRSSGTVRGIPSLTPDPRIAPSVRDAFLMVGEGTPKSIALATLTSRGLVKQSGGRVSAQQFNKMLANPIYAGRIVIHRWGLDVLGDFEAIITPEEFQRAQVAGKSATASAHHVLDHPDFPLRRTVRCGSCGTPLTASWSRGRNNRYGYYRCPRKGCGKTSIRREQLEASFEASSAVAALAQRSFRSWAQSCRTLSGNRTADSTARSALVERKVELAAKQERLVDAFLYKEMIDRPVYEHEMGRLREAVSRIEDELAEQADEIVHAAATFEKASVVLSDLRTYWQSIVPHAKPQFLTATFPSGLTCTDGAIGTRESSWLFDVFTPQQPGVNDLAARTGFEPVPPP